MPKLFQINITANWGSHGKITEGIGQMVQSKGWESYIAYGRWFNESSSHLYHIGSDLDEKIHGLSTRILDNHGLMSRRATKRLVHYIESIQPDIIHLHNIHGYYLNYPILFDFLSSYNKPVVWTLHDCWAYTGHCAHYMYVGCEKWKSHCADCPQKSAYPRSFLRDNSYRNFEKKRAAFSSLNSLVLVPVSRWLDGELQSSFLKDIDRRLVYNGIDTSTFHIAEDTDAIKQRYHIPPRNKMILGVASNWYHKGLEDFISLSQSIEDNYSIVLVGLNDKELKSIPKNIIGIKRTENVKELCKLYSAANVLFNPTWEDNFPTINLEAMACGTPVVTYATGGAAESIDTLTGAAIERGDLAAAISKIQNICQAPKSRFSTPCRKRIEKHFTDHEMCKNYFELYQELLSENTSGR